MVSDRHLALGIGLGTLVSDRHPAWHWVRLSWPQAATLARSHMLRLGFLASGRHLVFSSCCLPLAWSGYLASAAVLALRPHRKIVGQNWSE